MTNLRETATLLLLFFVLITSALLLLDDRADASEEGPRDCVQVAASDGRGLPACGTAA